MPATVAAVAAAADLGDTHDAGIEDRSLPSSSFPHGTSPSAQHVAKSRGRTSRAPSTSAATSVPEGHRHDAAAIGSPRRPSTPKKRNNVAAGNVCNTHDNSYPPILPGVKALSGLPELDQMELCTQSVPALLHSFPDGTRGNAAGENAAGVDNAQGIAPTTVFWPSKTSPGQDPLPSGVPLGWSPLTAFFFKANGGLPSGGSRLPTPRRPGSGTSDPLTPSLWLNNDSHPNALQTGSMPSTANPTTVTGDAGVLVDPKWTPQTPYGQSCATAAAWPVSATVPSESTKVHDTASSLAAGRASSAIADDIASVNGGSHLDRSTGGIHLPSNGASYLSLPRHQVPGLVRSNVNTLPAIFSPYHPNTRSVWRATSSWGDQEPGTLSLVGAQTLSTESRDAGGLHGCRYSASGVSLVGTSHNGWGSSFDVNTKPIVDASAYAHVRGSVLEPPPAPSVSASVEGLARTIIGQPPVAARAPRSRRLTCSSPNNSPHPGARSVSDPHKSRSPPSNVIDEWTTTFAQDRIIAPDSAMSSLRGLSPRSVNSEENDMALTTTTSSPPTSNSAASTGLEAGNYLTDAARWYAVQTRDPRASAAFFYCVLSTKIFCRTTCPSRRPIRENIFFVTSASQAASLGYRACRRCKPDVQGGDPHEERQELLISQVKERLMQGVYDGSNGKACKGKGLKYIAEELGVSHWHLHRCFKKRVGQTPEAWAKLQARKLRNSSREASPTVHAMDTACPDPVALRPETAHHDLPTPPSQSCMGAGNLLDPQLHSPSARTPLTSSHKREPSNCHLSQRHGDFAGARVALPASNFAVAQRAL
ncbi:unnamed protein product [Parajaminaea phylloscopi]